MGSQVSKTLEDFYNEIEKTSELKSFVTFPLNETNEESLLMKARVEYVILSSKTFTGKNIESFINLNDVSEIVAYLTHRIESTKNTLLSAKYNELLYIISKNNSYCVKSIDNYSSYFNLILHDKEHKAGIFKLYDIYSKILTLSLPIKYKLLDLKQQYLSIITNSDYSNELRTMLALSVKRNGDKLLQATDIVPLPDIFIELAENNIKDSYIEHCLNLALFYATKVVNTSQMQNIHKLMGDLEMKRIVPADSANLAVEHINEAIYKKAIYHYKLAKQTDLLIKVQKQHEKNKQNKRYILIKSSVPTDPAVIKYLKNMQNTLENMPKRLFMLNLICAKCYPIITNNIIEDWLSNREPSFAEESMEYVVDDINANHKPADTREFHKFQFYEISINNSLNYIFESIISAITNKKVSYKQLHRYLNDHTGLGSELIKSHQGIDITYTWLSMIDIGLESFFNQIKLMLKGKPTDWRICIDILSIKFEGILRDMMGINGANITKISDKKTTSFLLEDILRMSGEDMKEAFYTCFDDDDLNLFQYVFSSKANCLNVRNCAAHAFYLPCDYTLNKALLVFLATLRLAKFENKDKGETSKI